MEELETIRGKITDIDLQIIDLISERLALASTIALYKQRSELAIFQPEREKQQHSRYWQVAVEKKINPKLVREIFEMIINEMTKLQYKEFQKSTIIAELY